MTASEVCRQALHQFPDDVSVMTELARLTEALNEPQASVKYYRGIVIEDATHTEAIASIGMYHFYNNQPELALRYYRLDDVSNYYCCCHCVGCPKNS